MNYHGHGTANVVDYLCDAMTLPNATSKDGDQMVYIGGKTNNALKLCLYANTDITIATGQAINFELEGYTADTVTSATPPFSDTDVHNYLAHKTSADGELSFSAGDRIYESVIPEENFNDESYDWLNLKITTDDDESSEKVDAWIEVVR